MIDTANLTRALEDVRRSRAYYAKADTDEEQALVAMVEYQSDLLEEMAVALIEVAQAVSTGEELA